VPIIFISGANDDRHGWDMNVPAFGDYRVITFDNRDVGGSPRADADYTLDEMAADTLGVLDRAGVESAHVVGHSLGSVIAQHLYLLAPGRVRSLTLVGSWAKTDHHLQTIGENWIHWADALSDEAFVAACAPYWVGPAAVNEWGIKTIVEQFVPAIRAQGRAAFQRQVRAALTHDLFARLDEFAVPTHVVWGEEEQCIRRALTDQLVEGIRGARFTVLPGVGHSPTVEGPEVFNPVVREFTQSVG
jgi:pimeloyl-ACP methyl ester carboxylesterase